MYDMVMYDMSMGSRGYWSWRSKMPAQWIECTAPSVDYAFYDAYRADSWAGAGARHRGLLAGGRALSAVT
jgi:hypothetical protein